MISRLQITFRGVLPSDAVREIVDRMFKELCGHLPTSARCHVVVDRAGAGAVCARVDIHSAGFQLCTTGQSLDTVQAVRDAFRQVHAHSAPIVMGRLQTKPLPGATRP